jgi:orotidine-5'-phosphate decarboxylase
MVKNFADKLIEKSIEQESIVCVGLDPVIDIEGKEKKRIPDSLVNSKIEKYGAKEGKGKAVEEFFCKIVEGLATEGKGVASLKPNYAFYAQFGFSGLRALESIIKTAHENRMMVILDYKRGDIGKTSQAYAIEGFEVWDADAVTVAPYMGSDSVGPFIELANEKGRGVYILNRTSNKGAKNIQNLTVKETDNPLYLEVSRCVKGEWSDGKAGTVGVVVGATSPEEYRHITGYFANSVVPQLIPGFGAQGGSVYDIFSGAILTYQELGLSKGDIKKKLMTKRGSSSSGIDFAWAISDNFDETEYVEASIKATKDFNSEINVPLKEYGISLE